LAFDCCTRRVVTLLPARSGVTPHHHIETFCFVFRWTGRPLKAGGCTRYVHRGIGYLLRVDLLYIARRLLKSLSIKQGIKYDSPESAYQIPAFIEFHKLKVDEILDPLASFSRSTSDSYRALGDTPHY
jgi:hypothetical protein